MRRSARAHAVGLVLVGAACRSGSLPNGVEHEARRRPRTSAAAVASADAGLPASGGSASKHYALNALDQRALPKALAKLPIAERSAWSWTRRTCDKAQVIAVHGFIDGEPVRATLTLQAKGLALDAVSIPSGAITKYRGRWESNVCSAEQNEYAGRLETTGGKRRETLHISLLLPDSIEETASGASVQRIRLKFEGREDPEQSEPSLELWELAADPRNELEPCRRALHTAADIDAGVRAPDGAALVAYSLAGSGELTLAELAGSPLAVKRSVDTGLTCEPGENCKAKLVGYELGGTAVALVATLQGQASRGQGNFTEGRGALLTLTPDGFALGARLPDTTSSDTAHGSVREHTTLYWVDGDREGRPEILVRHAGMSPEVLLGNDTLPGWDRRQHTLLAFGAGDKSYIEVEPAPTASPEVLERLTRGPGFAAF